MIGTIHRGVQTNRTELASARNPAQEKKSGQEALILEPDIRYRLDPFEQQCWNIALQYA